MTVRSAVDRLEKLEFVSRSVGAGGRLAAQFPQELRASPGELVGIVIGKAAVEAQFVQLVNQVSEELLVLDRPPYAQQVASSNVAETSLLSKGARFAGSTHPRRSSCPAPSRRH